MPPSFSNGCSLCRPWMVTRPNLVVNNVDICLCFEKQYPLKQKVHILSFQILQNPTLWNYTIQWLPHKGLMVKNNYSSITPAWFYIFGRTCTAFWYRHTNYLRFAKVEIGFPSQKKIVLENVTLDQIAYTLFETDARQTQSVEVASGLFTDITHKTKFRFFKPKMTVDFSVNRAIPYKSQPQGAVLRIQRISTGDEKLISILELPPVFLVPWWSKCGGSFAKKIPAFAADKNYGAEGAVFLMPMLNGTMTCTWWAVAEFDAGSKFVPGPFVYQHGSWTELQKQSR